MTHHFIICVLHTLFFYSLLSRKSKLQRGPFSSSLLASTQITNSTYCESTSKSTYPCGKTCHFFFGNNGHPRSSCTSKWDVGRSHSVITARCLLASTHPHQATDHASRAVCAWTRPFHSARELQRHRAPAAREIEIDQYNQYNQYNQTHTVHASSNRTIVSCNSTISTISTITQSLQSDNQTRTLQTAHGLDSCIWAITVQ
jgi:hypothetical protein